MSSENLPALSQKAAALTLLGGEPNLRRALALLADKDLKEAVSARTDKMVELGIKEQGASKKGLQIQINKRVHAELGLSVSEHETDSELQTVVSIIRERVQTLITEGLVGYAQENWREHDKNLKAKIYRTIEMMTALYTQSKRLV